MIGYSPWGHKESDTTERLHFIFLCVYFWLHGVFIVLLRLAFWLQRAEATLCCSAQGSHCGGFSSFGAQALGAWASAAETLGLCCSVACGVFPDQELNLCPLRCDAGS